MTTDEWVRIFVGVVTAITTVIGGIVRSNRAGRLRKELKDELLILKRLPPGAAAKPLIREGIERKSSELAALTLVPTRPWVFILAFFAFTALGAVVLVLILEGTGPLLFQAGAARGFINWLYVSIGVAASILLLRGLRSLKGERERLKRSSSRMPPETDTRT
jgi:hypothetical protein